MPDENTSTRSIWAAERDVTSRTLRIINEKGLHARASAKFVEVVEAHDAAAQVAKDGLSVSGDSIMGLLMLAASRGTSIEVQTSGAEAGKLADALEALVAARFGEEY
jgi:phosphocarrier protein HPr